MPLVYLLYRCPRCGQDPLEGEKDEATCSGCGTRYARGGDGGLILVREPSGEVWEVPGHRLTTAMEGWMEENPSASGISRASIRQSEVEVTQSGEEAPVWWGGELLGFAEAMEKPASGSLLLTDDALVLSALPGEKGVAAEGITSKSWPLLAIRAVQTSSSSLQFSPSSGGLVQFRFPHDSPFRWETLLRNALRRAYRRAGLGEIVEFQPRIVAE
ncbi:MAG: hypothetical protein MUO50_00105 [Longimicrobiales bacterium]|nr:hypothetical protein [Longimicrobiales bacterium]